MYFVCAQEAAMAKLAASEASTFIAHQVRNCTEYCLSLGVISKLRSHLNAMGPSQSSWVISKLRESSQYSGVVSKPWGRLKGQMSCQSSGITSKHRCLILHETHRLCIFMRNLNLI